MESKKDTVSNVQFTCPSSGCWQSLEEWFANLSTMLQTICRWTSPRLPYQPKHGAKRKWIFQRPLVALVVDSYSHLLSSSHFATLSGIILRRECRIPRNGSCTIQWPGSRKHKNAVNVEATGPKRFVQHCLVRVVAWKSILSGVLTAAGCWLAPRLPSVFFWGTLPVIAAIA